jgi:hypothetical protein
MSEEIVNKLNDNCLIQEEFLKFRNIVEDSDQEEIETLLKKYDILKNITKSEERKSG